MLYEAILHIKRIKKIKHKMLFAFFEDKKPKITDLNHKKYRIFELK